MKKFKKMFKYILGTLIIFLVTSNIIAQPGIPNPPPPGSCSQQQSNAFNDRTVNNPDFTKLLAFFQNNPNTRAVFIADFNNQSDGILKFFNDYGPLLIAYKELAKINATQRTDLSLLYSLAWWLDPIFNKPPLTITQTTNPNAQGNLILSQVAPPDNTNLGGKVATILKNGVVLPDRYSEDRTGTTDFRQTNISSIRRNGYEIKKEADKRVTFARVSFITDDLTDAEKALILGNPIQHTLQRHGPDVTDEALIKRSNTGIAPDGVKGPRLVSVSKFDTFSQLKLALSNIGPDSPAYQAQLDPNMEINKVNHELSGGSLYGRIYRRRQNTFVNSSKIRATYQKVGENHILISVFPVR